MRWLVLLLLASAGACISEEREQDLGDSMAADVNPHLPLIEDPLLNAYVATLGRQIAMVSARPEIDYTFYIVDTGIVNAFALPGGHIYLTRGLIERTRTGPEFAGVVAHEIAHVAERHGARKLQRELRTGSLVSVMYTTIFGGEPDILRDNSLQVANAIWSARHSRQDEREADRLAMKYLARTGVDPAGVVTLLETLHEEEQAMNGGGFAVDWFSTHPLTSNRLQEARQILQEITQTPVDTDRNLDLSSFEAFRMLVLFRSASGAVPNDP